MIKFLENLNAATSGRYTFLRLNNAEYVKSGKELRLRLIYPSEQSAVFTDADKTVVTDAVREMYPGVSVRLEFVKTFADKSTVTNKVVEYLNDNNKIVFERFSADDIEVEVSGNYIKVRLLAVPSVFGILEQGQFCDKLSEMLDTQFCSDVYVTLSEKQAENTPYRFDPALDNPAISVEGSTLIEVESCGKKIFGSVKREMQLSSNPVQIATIKQSSNGASVVLCGTVNGVAVSSFKNADYDPENPGKKKKIGTYEVTISPMTYVYRWFLNDTTGNIECVVYRDNEDKDLACLTDGDVVVGVGAVVISNKSNLPMFRPKTAWYAKIDFSKVKPLKETRSANATYHTVFPEKYFEAEQASIYDRDNRPTPKYLKGKSIVVFDVETTGRAPSDEIVEIGAVKLVDGCIIESFATLVDPEMPIPAESTAVHGIVDADVVGAPKIASVIPDFYKFSENCSLAGHNISFDYGFIKRAADKIGYSFDNELIDTLALARKYVNGQANNTLGVLCKFFDITLEGAHRADNDAAATAKLLVEIGAAMEQSGN